MVREKRDDGVLESRYDMNKSVLERVVGDEEDGVVDIDDGLFGVYVSSSGIDVQTNDKHRQ